MGRPIPAGNTFGTSYGVDAYEKQQQTNPVGHDVSVWTAVMAVENENGADDRQRAHEHYRREVHTSRTCTVPALSRPTPREVHTCTAYLTSLLPSDATLARY